MNMALQDLSRDSLYLQTYTDVPFCNDREKFISNMKEYVKYKVKYEDAVGTNLIEEQKISLIKDSLNIRHHKYINAYCFEVNNLDVQSRNAKKFVEYRTIISQGMKMQELFGYVKPSQYVNWKYDEVMNYCEHQVDMMTKPKQPIISGNNLKTVMKWGLVVVAATLIEHCALRNDNDESPHLEQQTSVGKNNLEKNVKFIDSLLVE